MFNRSGAYLCLLFIILVSGCGPNESNNSDCPDGESCAPQECSGNPELDSDQDGICDADDPCPNSDEPDSDGDGVCDSSDACEDFPDWFDVDQDRVPAACDTCDDASQTDADDDGVPDPCDVCAGYDDAIDSDGDGTPDGCDCDAACPDDDSCSDHPMGAQCVCSSDDPDDAEPCVDDAPRINGLQNIVMSAGRTVEVDFTVIEGHAAWADVVVETTSSNPMIAQPTNVTNPAQNCSYAIDLHLLSLEGNIGFNTNGLRDVDDISTVDLIFTESGRVRGEHTMRYDARGYFIGPMLFCGNAETLQIYEEGKLSPGVYAAEDDYVFQFGVGRAPGQSCSSRDFCWNGQCSRDGVCPEALGAREQLYDEDFRVMQWMQRATEVPGKMTLSSMSPGQTTIDITSTDGTNEATTSVNVQVVPGCPIEALPTPEDSSIECTGAGADEVCEIKCDLRKKLTNTLTGEPVSAVASCGDALSWQLSTDVDLACQLPQPVLNFDPQSMVEDIPHTFGITIEDINDKASELVIDVVSLNPSIITGEGVNISPACQNPRRVEVIQMRVDYTNDQNCFPDCTSELEFRHRGRLVGREELEQRTYSGGPRFTVCDAGRVVVTEADNVSFFDPDDPIASIFIPKLGGQDCTIDDECLSGTCEDLGSDIQRCTAPAQNEGTFRLRDPERDDFDGVFTYVLREVPDWPTHLVTITPEPDASGFVELNFFASDDEYTASRKMGVTVEPDCERGDVPQEFGQAVNCSGRGPGSTCELACINGYRFSQPSTPTLACNGDTFRIDGPTPPPCVLEPTAQPQDTFDGLDNSCPALYWQRDMVSGCDECSDSLGNARYAAVDYSLNAYLEAGNAIGLSQQPGTSGCDQIPACQQDRALAHASANADASLFGERFTVVQGLFEGRVEGGRAPNTCNCAAQPELAQGQKAVARADAELALLGNSIVDEHKQLPGELIALGPYGYPIIPTKCVEEEVAGISVDACVELVAGIQLGVDVGPRFGIPQFVGVESDIVPSIGLFSNGKAGIGSDDNGVALTLEMDLLEFSLHNVASVDAYMGVCAAQAPYIELNAESFLTIDLLNGRFSAEACLFGGCIKDDWQVNLPVNIPKITLLRANTQRINL